MNKKLLAAALAGILSATGDANAFYVGVAGGTSRTEYEGNKIGSDRAFTVSAGLGLPIPLFSLRAEAEYLDLKSSDDAGEVSTRGFAANGYINLPLLPIVHPYLGLGLASLKQDSGAAKSDSKIAPQYMAGLDVDIPLLPIAGGIEYRYIDTKFEYGGTEASSKIHSLLAKVRFSF